MRRLYWITSLLILTTTILLFVPMQDSAAADVGLSLLSPITCPSTGCAAGQRLNFRVEFSISPQNADPNTQICVYAPSDSQPEEANPWADFESGWISQTGLVSGEDYKQGQVDSICTDHLDPGDEWLTGVYASLKTGTFDRLDFAVHIHPDTDSDGYIKVKVLQRSTNSGAWILNANFKKSIIVAEFNPIVYVAQSPNECSTYQPCFVNSGDDLEDGIGTGLRDAVMAVKINHEIRILKNFPIKDHTVLVDKNVKISGHENALITYIGNVCTSPMIILTNGGSLRNLTINDGNCIIPSRNLIEIDSADDVAIEHNTLEFGSNAIFVDDNSGDVTIAFNHINNNDQYAVWRAFGEDTGIVNLFANNIINNRMGYQVHCNERGVANHNFWGVDLLATNNAAYCTVSNSKRLGAAILFEDIGPGVQARRQTVSTQMSYAFDEKVGVQRTTGNDFDVIIVNHGQGLASNIPFYQTGLGDIVPCSNFYDIFLAENAVANDLTLTFRYDLNDRCVTRIESNEFCGGNDSTQYPLWWFDPALNVTDGWDRTGQNPQGPGASGAIGQETICHLSDKEIRVIIDNTGRPGISNDLNFTPFVVGLPLTEGMTLSQFTAQFDGNDVIIDWRTTSENNIQGFHVIRADTQDGTYARISRQIEAIGDTHIGGIYQFIDTSTTYGKMYYYKLELINTNGVSIGTHGPVSTLTPTTTPTVTPTLDLTQTQTLTPTITLTGTLTTFPTATRTRTPTPFFYRSPTPYFYRSPTPITYRSPTPFQPNTATPSGDSTPMPTFGPSPTGTQTIFITPDETPDPSPGYPIDWDETRTPTLMPSLVLTEPTVTPVYEPSNEDMALTPIPETEDQPLLLEDFGIFFVLGIASGLGLIGAVSLILAKYRIL